MTNDTKSPEEDIVKKVYKLLGDTKETQELIRKIDEWIKIVRDLSYQEGCDEGYDAGYDKGWDDGRTVGEAEGHDKGYDEAIRTAEERIQTHGYGLDSTQKFRLGRIIRGQF